MRTRDHSSKKGFTLIELMVTLTIGSMLLVAVMLLDIGPKGKPSVDATSQQLSILVRQALTYGLAIVGTNNNFDVGYGVRINTNQATQATLYVDVNKNNIFDAGDTTLQTLTFPTDAKLIQFCGDNGSTPTCYAAGASSNTLDITFARSSFVGTIRITPTSGLAVDYATTTITLGSISHSSITEVLKVNRAGLIEILGI